MPEAEAADKLLAGLRELLHMPDAEEALLAERLQAHTKEMEEKYGEQSAASSG